MKVELTDEQYAAVYHALGMIAASRFKNKAGNFQNLSRTAMVDIARQAFADIKQNWQTYLKTKDTPND